MSVLADLRDGSDEMEARGWDPRSGDRLDPRSCKQWRGGQVAVSDAQGNNK